MELFFFYYYSFVCFVCTKPIYFLSVQSGSISTLRPPQESKLRPLDRLTTRQPPQQVVWLQPRGARFARWLPLFVVRVCVGRRRGVARRSQTWQEPCCFWERVKRWKPTRPGRLRAFLASPTFKVPEIISGSRCRQMIQHQRRDLNLRQLQV